MAWISLSPADSDPDRFSRYLVAAVHTVRPGSLPRTAALLSAPTAPPWSYLTEVVVSELAELDGAVVLALDDYQVISSEEIHELVSTVVENLSGGIHLAILSRVDPPLPLARWRTRGWLSELRARDLRFDAAEVRAYFATGDSRGLSEEGLDVLGQKTEGWIAGLQLARLSLARASDPHETVRRFSGSDRLIADYLIEEVLAAQSPEMRELLAVTAHLKRFCAPLCERLLSYGSERPSAADLLAHLERENLFLVPLDAERRWFRYHHLFGDLLAHQLPGAASEDSRRNIARRAAE